MTIDTSGKWWIGGEPEDIEEYLRAYTVDAYLADMICLSRCECGGVTFTLEVGEEKGAARRTCADCSTESFVFDSENYWEEGRRRRYKCRECKSKKCNVGVGYSLYADEERDPSSDVGVRWIYIGVRCAGCGVLGCMGDWKLGQSFSISMLEKA